MHVNAAVAAPGNYQIEVNAAIGANEKLFQCGNGRTKALPVAEPGCRIVLQPCGTTTATLERMKPRGIIAGKQPVGHGRCVTTLTG